MISSASGRLFDKYQNEARIMHNFLIRIGFPTQDIIIDTLSENTSKTQLNARESSKKTILMVILTYYFGYSYEESLWMF